MGMNALKRLALGTACTDCGKALVDEPDAVIVMGARAWCIRCGNHRQNYRDVPLADRNATYRAWAKPDAWWAELTKPE
jgi:hypothetical protein